MSTPRIFWDVDTQHDFMDVGGKLYVPDAESIRPNLKRLTDFAHERGLRIVASADDHEPGHRELSATPDFQETFPEHCMRGTPGARKIPETALSSPLIIEPAPTPVAELARMLHVNVRDVLIRKHWFDVFSNSNTSAVLDALTPEGIVIYGVATDVCNHYAIEGFLRRGNVRVLAVTDAMKPINVQRADAILASWQERGVKLVSTDAVLGGA